MLITPATLAPMWLGFNTLFQGAMESAKPLTGRFSMQVPSNSEGNVFAFMTQLPRFRQWVGERVVNNLSAKSYRLNNVTFEDTVSVEREKIEDDQFGVYNPIFQEFGRVAGLWLDDLTIAALRNGDSTSLATAVAYDGVPFFSQSHPVDPDDASKGTQSNLFSSATSGARALTAANYDATRVAMQGYLGMDGFPLNILPNLLVVPPQLERTARTIVQADVIPADSATGGTGAPVRNVLAGSAEVLVVPQLNADPTTWYLMDTSRYIKPMVQQQRRAPVLVPRTSPTDPVVFDTNKFLFGADARGAAGYGMWFLAAKCVG